jgi:hypothetical protein
LTYKKLSGKIFVPLSILYYFCPNINDMIMSRTVFNEAQLELLNVMASVKDDAELLALKHAISEFFARRADEEMEKLWQSGEWNEQTLQDLKNAHYRTPYQQ